MKESVVQEEEKEAVTIYNRLRKRDFSGYTGLAIKNSTYQFGTTIVSKVGSLIFMVIVARILMPELFGLYSLALSTILIFASLSDLGIGQTLIRFVSKYHKKPKGYIIYLGKIKFYLTFLVSFLLLASAYAIARWYYQKPIFFALLAGSFFILVMGFLNFLSSLFYAENDFKRPFYREIFFQIIRLIAVPLVILALVANSEETLFLGIFLTLSFCYLASVTFLARNLKKYKGRPLRTEQKSKVMKFAWPLSAVAFSGVFFGYIDIIMLGRFVASEFIAYYQAAFSLASSAMILITFSIVLLPIFSRLKGKRLKRGLHKAVLVTLPLGIGLFVVTFFIAPYVVRIIYGSDYLLATNLLRILSLLLITGPLTSIYADYYISQGKTVFVAKLLVTTTIINIILNYFFITRLLGHGMYYAAVGASIATIISKGFYLGGLILLKSNK